MSRTYRSACGVGVVKVGKAQGLLWATKEAASAGFDKVIVEGDSMLLLDAVNGIGATC